MEENKEKEALDEEEVVTELPEMAKRQMESYISIKEKEREIKEANHKEDMKDLAYRRWYYQNEIQKHMNMIPREYYYQAEYEEIETLCEKSIKQIDTLEDEADMEEILNSFRKKASKKWDANKIVLIVLISFLVLFIGFLIFLFILNMR